jgi:SAM-dependent methyltransferase
MVSRNVGTKRLTVSQMLQEAHCDTTIEELMDSYQLEIEDVKLGPYPKYTPRKLLHHYQVEVELARQLRNAPKTERARLYAALYDELFRRVPYHPQLHQKSDPTERTRAVERQLASLSRYLHKDSTFVEIGAGDCRLSFEAAKRLKRVYAIDVSSEVTKNIEPPENVELILSDGTSVDVPPESVDVAYSNQLMEHLHPDDAIAQLQAIYRALVPGGIYICITPHRFGGPLDISRFFDKVATGFHLKEYTNRELRDLFRQVGFSRFARHTRLGHRYIKFPLGAVTVLEAMISRLPPTKRRAMYFRLRMFLSIRLLAYK